MGDLNREPSIVKETCAPAPTGVTQIARGRDCEALGPTADYDGARPARFAKVGAISHGLKPEYRRMAKVRVASSNATWKSSRSSAEAYRQNGLRMRQLSLYREPHTYKCGLSGKAITASIPKENRLLQSHDRNCTLAPFSYVRSYRREGNHAPLSSATRPPLSTRDRTNTFSHHGETGGTGRRKKLLPNTQAISSRSRAFLQRSLVEPARALIPGGANARAFKTERKRLHAPFSPIERTAAADSRFNSPRRGL